MFHISLIRLVLILPEMLNTFQIEEFKINSDNLVGQDPHFPQMGKDNFQFRWSLGLGEGELDGEPNRTKSKSF